MKLHTCLFAAALLVGPGVVHAEAYHIADPWQDWNRGVFGFNQDLDRSVIKPVAEGYRTVVPKPGRTVVRNIFSNIDDLYQMTNNILQGKFPEAAQDVLRFGFNTTWGFLGILDIATEAGIPKHHEDVGKTLQRWGAPPGPYLVLPVLGPSTVRDAIGTIASIQWLDPLLGTGADQVTWRAVDGLAKREGLLEAGEALDDLTLDAYLSRRDIYAEKRGEGTAEDMGDDVLSPTTEELAPPKILVPEATQ